MVAQEPVETVPVFCGASPAQYFKGIHAIVQMRNPDADWVDLPPDQAAQFIAAFNASPPVSDISLDASVRLYTKPGSDRYFMVIHMDGCVKQLGEVPSQIIKDWIAGKPYVDPASSRGWPPDHRGQEV